METKTVLIHLHPDFAELLASVLRRWNNAQKALKFIGVRPKREHELKLLTGGKIKSAKLFPVLANVRTEAGYSGDDEIIAFTEKRISDEEYDQLYLDGTLSDGNPPNITLISLDFTRKEFKNIGKDKNLIFQSILSNIISSLAQSDGFKNHDETRGCPLDFCDVMSDVVVNIKNEFRFCDQHVKQIKNRKKEYLLKLSSAIKGYGHSTPMSKAVSERILSTAKARLQKKEKFNFDIAVSYASEDRRLVDQVARLLIKNDVKIFYDQFEKANLWGKDLLPYLTDVYMRAKFCVMFLSKNYAKSRWTDHEKKAAQTQAFKMKREYILPVRIDHSTISGILPVTAYLEWRAEGAKGITQLVLQKLKSV